MYKILLADEEGVALKALHIMIDSEYGESCDIRLAANRQQFMEIYPKFLPDLVFLNIEMAGMRGISTIRNLHTTQPKCLYIIVSYSNSVDYGREGKNLGIYSYMPKPFRMEPVKNLLKTCLAQISRDQKKEEMEQYNKQQWDTVVPIIESAMISEILYPDPQKSNLSLYHSFLNIDSDFGWICDLKYGQTTEHGTMCNPIGSVVTLTSGNLFFRKIIKAFFPGAVIGPILANHVIFLVPCKNASLSSTEEEARRKRMAELSSQLQKKLSLRFRYGLSEVYPFPDLYEGVLTAREHPEI